MIRRLLPVLLLLAGSLPAGSLPAGAQDAGLAFLRIGSNAAASAMGDGGVAYTRDAFATYWNPAGLAAAASNGAALSHVIWLGNVRTYALAGRFRAGRRGGVGVFVNATSSGNLQAREGPTAEPDGFFDAQFVSVGAAYGRRFGPLRLGAGVKYLSERLYVNDATGYAVDLGAQLGLWQEGLLLGAAWQNLGRMNALEATATPLPRLLRAGVAVRPFRILAARDGAEVLHLLLNAELSHVFPEERTQLHAGGSARVLDIIWLRAGVITDDAVRRFTFGAGLDYSALVFDYAFLPFDSGFGRGHVLTLSYAW
ncbi:hypothetical protein AWN76_010205 [Rhodothermaceae bacterium RA]|nr:hypothetical protein AWN76_010205 [Rhodothermaceae bacterium RA]